MKIVTTLLLVEDVAAGIDGSSFIMTVLVIIAFLAAWALNRISVLRIKKHSARIKETSAIMKHTLNLSGDYILKLSIADHYASNIHGDFLPAEGLTFEESENYMHPDDWPTYVTFLRQLIQGNKDAKCTFRWNVTYNKEKPEWHYIHDVAIVEFANEKLRKPTNIFCTLTDKTEAIVQEQEEYQLSDKYRMIFEQSIVGLAFYDKDGYLLTANHKMREILKFQSEHDPYYFNSTIYEMPTFREVLNNRQVEELWFCTKSVIAERGVNCYTELRVHPIYDEEGSLVYITFSIRDITQERELYLQNKQNDEHIRQQNTAIQQYETELQYLMENCDMRFWRASFADRQITFYKGLSMPEQQMSLEALAKHLADDDFRSLLAHPEVSFNEPITNLIKTIPIFHETDNYQWNFIDSLPYYDETGHTIGAYGIIRNVTELIEKQEQLKRETERAKDSGHMKSVFMANMTHEIRTPLNSIVGFSDVLPMLQTPEEKQEIIKVIMNNCDMLLRLINDILAVSTLDSSGMTIEEREVDFSRTFDEICQSMSERVQNPAVTFIADNPYASLVTTLDPGRMQQVITNFVTNAVKYTQEGHIKVGYDHRDEGLYLYCEDTGAGIPKEDQKKVFERFVKLNDYVQGTGLGLSICKAIAERCHGKIGVESEGQGKGSTFWLWIPIQVNSVQPK
ncbi:MAG: PAS domain-containing protein [Prevotella sp.]|nr:PAS domain-containing protein [Prevotella sp.]